MQTMKVMPWGKGQGDFVLINKDDFDPKVHKPFDDAKAKKPDAPKGDDAKAK